MGSGDYNMADSPGKIRPAQIITTFGPGALMQTEHDSVMIMGYNFWKNTESYVKKNHLYLQKITKRNHFKMPYSEEGGGKRNIACISYPQWGHCTICKELQRHRSSPGYADHFKCKRHNKVLLPARLVAVCKRGHVGEFPWVEWAHSNPTNPKPICDDPTLSWERGNRSSSISDSSVKCSCGARNWLYGALKSDGIILLDGEKKHYTYQCRGESPWLNKQEQCRKIDNAGHESSRTETPVGMLTRSSSLYYPKIIRGIVIPHLAHPIAQYLQSDDYRKSFEDIQVLRELSYEEKAEQILKMTDSDWKDIQEYEKSDIIHFMKKLKNNANKFKLDTEEDLREIEYEDLLNNDNPRGEQGEEIHITDVELPEEASTYFDKVKMLNILTSIEISRYFTRLHPPGEINSDERDANMKYICNIETSGKTKSGRKHKKEDWLPCSVKRGEGIFVTFKKEFIESCLNQDGARSRLDDILRNYREWERRSEWSNASNIDRQYILLHSLSHVLIKTLARSSGYSDASVSERIYSSKKMHGILIYTTSSGDGSLGGLVRQATDIFDLFKEALAESRSCSRDPICIAEDPRRMLENNIPLHLAQNGSACYGCIMLPETSCECFNKLLDRRILTDEEYGVAGRINGQH